MSTSLIYRNRTLYEVLMRGLYGRYYTARYRAVAAAIPAGASVLDLCCGPATLYTRYLRQQSIDYTGLDLNDGFITELTKAGGRGLVWDMNSDAALPAADYVLMQASLYHFLPDPSAVVDRMLTAARDQVIIAEPIRNLATSDNRVLAAIGQRFTNAGTGAQAHRFTEDSLDEFFARYAERVVRSEVIAGGREKLYVLSA
ncbi:methyltransferase domain-containing protein [Nocardia sp. NPDC050712]|uniref:class I SAM-dependent methyltransferase n=1 Tax=Nocardia sp. NPDC050712 TaxID=3155518 RepID=UPI0033E96596